MANRPKRSKKPASQSNTFSETDNLDGSTDETSDLENKTYRNQPKKRKPFVNYISIKKYKPKNLDRYFRQ